MAPVVDEQGLVVRKTCDEAPRGLLPVLEAAQDAVCVCGGEVGVGRKDGWSLCVRDKKRVSFVGEKGEGGNESVKEQ